MSVTDEEGHYDAIGERYVPQQLTGHPRRGRHGVLDDLEPSSSSAPTTKTIVLMGNMNAGA